MASSPDVAVGQADHRRRMLTADSVMFQLGPPPIRLFVNSRSFRARCVPDQAVKPGNSWSLVDTRTAGQALKKPPTCGLSFNNWSRRLTLWSVQGGVPRRGVNDLRRDATVAREQSTQICTADILNRQRNERRFWRSEANLPRVLNPPRPGRRRMAPCIIRMHHPRPGQHCPRPPCPEAPLLLGRVDHPGKAFKGPAAALQHLVRLWPALVRDEVPRLDLRQPAH